MYKDSINYAAKEIEFKNVSILVTGATGLIGSCAIDTLIAANEELGLNIKIYALGRNEKKIRERFSNYVIPVVQDITMPLSLDNKYDFILHGASNADPRTYAVYPVETIITNIIGTKNVLDYCVKHINTRVLLTSTFEVYGEIDKQDVYSENMSGIIDQTILRNGYPESKRSSELLLRSYVDEYSVNALIARLPSVYGPTMLESDSKAHAQFIKNALNGQDIVLKSRGEQIRTYCYVVDVVRAIFKILKQGNNGEIYNVSNENSIASIAEIAKICSDIAGTNVIYNLPDEVEARGFSRSKNCILDNKKLRKLGWNALFPLDVGLKETISELKNRNYKYI